MSAAHPDIAAARRDLRVRTSLHLLAGAANLMALLAAGYAFFVWTPAGQAIDNAGYAGRQIVGGEAKTYDMDLLGEVTRRSLLYSLGALFAVSLILRRPVVGLLAVGAAAAAVIGAEFLKAHLPREILSAPLTPVPAYFSSDTYPSGHTTIGTSLGLVLVVVAGPLLRPWIAVLAGAVSASYATAVLFMGWHRPSDALGGIFWSGLCLGAAAALAAIVHGHHAPPARSPAWMVSAAIAAVSAIALGTIVFSTDAPHQVPFFGMSAAIIAAAFAVPAWLAAALGHVDWKSSLGR